MRSSRAFVALFFVLVAAVLAFSDHGHISSDGEDRFRALVALVEEGRLTPEKYSLVQPLLASPLYVAGALTAREEGREPRVAAAERFVRRFNKLVALLLCAVAYRAARRLFLFTEREAALATVGVLFASLLVPNARDFFSECLWTLLSLSALLMLSGDGEARALPAVLALAVPLCPLLVPVFALVLAFLWTKERARRRHALLGALGLGLGIALFCVENQLRRGSPFATGYEEEGFTTPLATGLLGQLLAPARGIVFFLPAFLLGVVLAARFRRAMPEGARRFVVLSLVFSAGVVLAYARWHAWHGSVYWGPRFLLPLSVLGALYLSLLAKTGWESPVVKVAVVFLAAEAFFVRKVGVAVGHRDLIACVVGSVARGGDPERCYWSFAQSPFAPLFSAADRARMLGDRSTAVELGALCLFALLALAASRRAARTDGDAGELLLERRRSS